MIVSPLAKGNLFAPHHGGRRTEKITRITPHCFVGQCTAVRMAQYFYETERNISCNYVIGYDGKIICVEPEEIRTYCSSSYSNDNRAITVEIASDTTEPYTMTGAAFNALVYLCADICKRYHFTILAAPANLANVWDSGEICALTAHRWFDSTACPGNWMYSRLGKLAHDVNYQLERGGDDMKVFRTVNDLPEWAKPTINKLMKKGYLAGQGDGVINLSEDLVRALVINDRAKLYGE